MTTLVYPKTDAAVMEVVIYKIQKSYTKDFEEILSKARETIEGFPGFIEYQTLRSVSNDHLFVDLVKWKSFAEAKNAAKKVEEMKDLAPFMAAFDQILVMDHFRHFTDEIQNSEKLDLFKTDKNYYKSSPEPAIIEIPATNYLSLKGLSSPEDEQFLCAIEAIYAVAYSLKYTSKVLGHDFVVPKMEGQWWVESELPFEEVPREEWHWNILIRLPDFITPQQVDKSAEEVVNKNNLTQANEVNFITLMEGTCVQILHIGSYDNEKGTLEKMMSYIQDRGKVINGYHHEIYISDPRKTPSEKLKTLIRYPIR